MIICNFGVCIQDGLSTGSMTVLQAGRVNDNVDPTVTCNNVM